jgi:hypothetical protein
MNLGTLNEERKLQTRKSQSPEMNNVYVISYLMYYSLQIDSEHLFTVGMAK